MHLGWNLLAIAAGGGGIDIRPLRVDGAFHPPAYLLADSLGRLHTPAAAEDQEGLELAVADVRDVVGFPEIVLSGACWPADSVFRARLSNPVAEITDYLGAADFLVLPHPQDWPQEKVETYCDLVASLGVEVDPLPESVALAAYVRATESVRGGVTAVYCDGRCALVVAVHADADRPTESVDVPVARRACNDPSEADRMVSDIMGAAASLRSETATVVLAGPVCFDDSAWLAFRNHLGRRLHVADHPMHAIALGAVDLWHNEELAIEDDAEDSIETTGGHIDSALWS